MQEKVWAVYTIVETRTDSDRGSFPTPQAVGSYLSLPRARRELECLKEKYTEELDDSRYNRCDQGEDFWEVYQDGYAAACFHRLEILVSTLYMNEDKEKLED